MTDDRTIAVPYKVLNSELQCPVCMSIVKNACVVMEVSRPPARPTQYSQPQPQHTTPLRVREARPDLTVPWLVVCPPVAVLAPLL